jgi:5-formyltetrahydrofolate cyclo-ligase
MGENKKEIRKFMREKRGSLTKAEKERLDNAIFDNVVNSKEYKESKNIFIFVSYDTEVDTHRLIKQALKDEKVLCVPRVISKEEGMIIAQIKSFEDLEPGAYGILEPKDNKFKVDETLIDVAYLPGLAFDKVGGRVGYGGGFYDRFLRKSRKDSKKIGLAYSFQILEKVPMEQNNQYIDEYIDGIITD